MNKIVKETRILLFVQDGAGLGHLSRMSRIASYLQNYFTVLIVTAKREASWMIPNDCEFIKIPSWKSMRKKLAQHWNKKMWINISETQSIEMISEFNYYIEKIFCPDVIITDYLPFGKLGELKSVLESSNAKKYLILRGIIDTSDKKHYSPESQVQIGSTYNRILVACDKKIIDVINEYEFIPNISERINSIGYIEVKRFDAKTIREKNKVSSKRKWIVCSSGGGKDSEVFLNHCIEISNEFPSAIFHVIYGPYSRTDLRIESTPNKNCSIFIERIDLPELLQSCDIAIINGGYNSLMESITGTAQIIVQPNQTGLDDEQQTHSQRLSKFYPITILDSYTELSKNLRRILVKSPNASKKLDNLNFNGLKMIKDYIEFDLKLSSTKMNKPKT